ncbi:glycerol-3-phosphate acyltransferase [Chloroflexota bacterium]
MTLTSSDLWIIVVAAIAYLMGSFPTAYYVTKWAIGSNIQSSGSGNVGAMNCYRLIKDEKSTTLGIIGFVTVLLGDMGKGVLAIFVAKWLSFLGYGLLPAFVAGSFFVVLGHNYSVFFKFKSGGRGISSIGGALLALNPLAFAAGISTLLLCIVMFQHLFIARVNWSRFSDVFSVVGSQVLGRVLGLALALVPLYFFGPEVFFPILAADILVLMKHVERVKAFIQELSRPK